MPTTDTTTYNLSDLLEGAPALRALVPPARLSVFGSPVEHSKSPALHNAALSASGINAQYVRIRVEPDELGRALHALPDAGFAGTNITLPHKSAAIDCLDEVDRPARLMGAVNTVVVDGTRLIGFNTDGPGIVRAIHEEFYVDLRDLRVMVLGAGGGAGRAIAVQCALEGCERLVLVNRTVEKARALAAELDGCFRSDRLVGPIDRLAAIGFDEPALAREIAHTDLVINATTVGMRRTDPALISEPLLTPNLMIYDTIYSAGDTRLLRDGRAAGARTANGLSMLLHQGALSFEIWFNRDAPLDAMRTALSRG